MILERIEPGKHEGIVAKEELPTEYSLASYKAVSPEDLLWSKTLKSWVEKSFEGDYAKSLVTGEGCLTDDSCDTWERKAEGLVFGRHLKLAEEPFYSFDEYMIEIPKSQGKVGLHE